MKSMKEVGRKELTQTLENSILTGYCKAKTNGNCAQTLNSISKCDSPKNKDY
jgi:hypothetical protein